MFKRDCSIMTCKMKSRTHSKAEHLPSWFLIPEPFASFISLFWPYTYISPSVFHHLLHHAPFQMHKYVPHTSTHTHRHTHCPGMVSLRPRERERQSSSRLTRADLIKLPVTLTNLLVLSHCVESSPPSSPRCTSIPTPPVLLSTLLLFQIHKKEEGGRWAGKKGAINVI